MSSVVKMTSTRVGELACQRQPFLRELAATVVSCDEVISTSASSTSSSAAAKKSKTGSKTTAAAPDAKLYDIVLSDSLLFPVGGGQPCDYGTLSWSNCSNTISIVDNDTVSAHQETVEVRVVQRNGSTCVLRCDKPVSVGRSVLTRVDWPRRFDHMQHHTGQHLLSAMIEREDVMRLPTVSWSLTHPYCFIQLDLTEMLAGESEVKCDDDGESCAAATARVQHRRYAQHITSEKKISEEMIRHVEQMCNDAIAAALPITVSVYSSREEYEAEQRTREMEQMSMNSNNPESNTCDAETTPNNAASLETHMNVNHCEDNKSSSNDAINSTNTRNNSQDCDTNGTSTTYSDTNANMTSAGGDMAVFRSRPIPADVQGPIRIINIDAGRVDSCTCCGVHLTNLAQLHVMHLLHQEVKGTQLRVYFVTGERALRRFTQMYGNERALTAAMEGTQPESFVDVARRRTLELSQLQKRCKKWAMELAELEVMKVVRQLQSLRSTQELNQCRSASKSESVSAAHADAEAELGGPIAVPLRRDDVDMSYFALVREGLDEAGWGHVVLVCASALGSATTAESNSGSNAFAARDVQGQIVISGGEAQAMEGVVAMVRETLADVRGGVSKGVFRGKGSLSEWKTVVKKLHGGKHV